MTLIDFEDTNWGGVQGTTLCHSGPNHGIDAQWHDTEFIIGEGTMEVMQSQSTSNRFLFFKPEDCNGNTLSTSTLVIRFDTPQAYVRFVNDMDFVKYLRVVYYRDHGQKGEVENRTVINRNQRKSATEKEVEYNSILPRDPVKELTIITDAPENRFLELEFGLGWWGRFWRRLRRRLRRARLRFSLRDWLWRRP